MFEPTQEQIDFKQELLNGTESILLSAVAGSGKTSTMVWAAQDLPPHMSTLACAFNSKIAKELGEKMPAHVTCKTLNALGHKSLFKGLGGKVKLNSYKIGSIVSDLCKQYSELKDHWHVLTELASKAKAEGMLPPNHMGAKGLVPLTKENLEALAAKHNIDAGSDLFSYVEEILTTSFLQAIQEKIVDFDDQLYLPALIGFPMEKFDIIFIDEAQDLSAIQHRLLSKMSRPTTRFIIIGDPNQAIYGFRGAEANSLSTLAETYSAKELPLTVNFRCGTNIIKHAQEIIPRIQAMPGAIPGQVIATDTWAFTIFEGHPDSAVLCRNVFPLVKLGFACIRKNIGVHFIGRDMGKNLQRIVKKFPVLRSPEALILHIQQWRDAEVSRAGDKLEVAAAAEDNADTLMCIVENTQPRTSAELIASIAQLFEAEHGNVQLSTIHRAKGLEWTTVFHLDSWRVPAKFAKLAADKDTACQWMLEQEHNLSYIARTRAKHSLIYINTEQCLDIPKKNKEEEAA